MKNTFATVILLCSVLLSSCMTESDKFRYVESINYSEYYDEKEGAIELTDKLLLEQQLDIELVAGCDGTVLINNDVRIVLSELRYTKFIVTVMMNYYGTAEGSMICTFADGSETVVDIPLLDTRKTYKFIVNKNCDRLTKIKLELTPCFVNVSDACLVTDSEEIVLESQNTLLSKKDMEIILYDAEFAVVATLVVTKNEHYVVPFGVKYYSVITR